MIARNDGTKLSSLTNDSPANRENERGRNEDREREGEWRVRNLLGPDR